MDLERDEVAGEATSAEDRAPMSRLRYIPIDRLVEAEWNWKEPGDAAMMAKLVASIRRDRSAGVLPVRRLPDGRYEVLDGNHRLRAIREIGWTEVQAEDFGEISLAEAVLVAQRRNYQWFRDDLLALGDLFKEVVLPEISIEEIATFDPLDAGQIGDLARIREFGWDDMTPKGSPKGRSSGREGYKLSIVLDDESARLWGDWVRLTSSAAGGEGEATAFRRLLATAVRAREAGFSSEDDG